LQGSSELFRFYIFKKGLIELVKTREDFVLIDVGELVFAALL
jgi:hypothetical protein